MTLDLSPVLLLVLIAFLDLGAVYLILRLSSQRLAADTLSPVKRNTLRRQYVALCTQLAVVLPLALAPMASMELRRAVFPFTPVLLLPLTYIAGSSIRHGVSIEGLPLLRGARGARISGVITLALVLVLSGFIIAVSPR